MVIASIEKDQKFDDPDVIHFGAGDDFEPIAECYDQAHVIAFLEATTGADRAEAAIAHFGDRAHYEDRAQMQRLVDRLIAEGADAERCKLLLEAPDDTR